MSTPKIRMTDLRTGKPVPKTARKRAPSALDDEALRQGYQKALAAERAANEDSILQALRDLEASGLVSLQEGVRIAHGFGSLEALRRADVTLQAAVARTYKTAQRRYANPNYAEQVGRTVVAEDELLVEPRQLFAWLNGYLNTLPEHLSRWLQASASGEVTSALKGANALVDSPVAPMPPANRRMSAPGHLVNHARTARDLLALIVLMNYYEDLQGDKPSWKFLNATKMSERLKPLTSLRRDGPVYKTMKSHIARAIVDCLSKKEAAEKFPGLLKLADHPDGGVT